MIPVVDIVGVTSHAKENPISTAVTVLMLVLIALVMVWIFKTFPKARAKFTFGIFAIYLAGAGWLNWQMFKEQPTLSAVSSNAVSDFPNYLAAIKSIDVVMLNKNDSPRPGDRLSFKELQGEQCIYHGKVEQDGVATMNRRACPDGTVTMLNVLVPLEHGGTGDSHNHYKAFVKEG
ncbi:hypothetical protein HBO11_28085 [Pseudomonas sp. WS 5010]|uniref:hypothetical protein n=1 Tax=Pseudomonas sp. WS 5010 TaxID=2717489 RepID=UPI001473FC1F|nr:hypothetical protein [Pseudomonas sp. WS 5010]NMX89426.1 hypothetical protein [Pseudomonas sp. WS 5010]